MNDLQKCELDILIAFDKICKKEGLTYFLAYGTALGAVRHSGFIPWDDDIDVIMLREDYMKLMTYTEQFYKEGLFLQTAETDFYYPYPFAKIRRRGTSFVELGSENLAINHGVFIDIFPFDAIPESRLLAFIQRLSADMLWGLMARNRHPSGVKKTICFILNWGLNSKEKYISRYKRIEKRLICNGAKKSGFVTDYSFGGRGKVAKSILNENIFIPQKILFEGREFTIMEGYDTYLTKAYGNYMELPPEELRVPCHDYFYFSLTDEYHPQ